MKGDTRIIDANNLKFVDYVHRNLDAVYNFDDHRDSRQPSIFCLLCTSLLLLIRLLICLATSYDILHGKFKGHLRISSLLSLTVMFMQCVMSTFAREISLLFWCGHTWNNSGADILGIIALYVIGASLDLGLISSDKLSRTRGSQTSIVTSRYQIKMANVR